MSDNPESVDDVAGAVRDLLAAAEQDEARAQAEWEAAKLRATIAKAAHSVAAARTRQLARVLGILSGGLPSGTGRPRGSGDPTKTRLQVLQVLREDPARVWKPSELRGVLAEQGHDATASQVTAALSALRQSGDAVREAPKAWRAFCHGT